MKKCAVLLFLVCAAGCGDQAVPLMQQRVIPTRPPAPPHVDYFAGMHAAEAVKQVRDKVGEPFRVLEISVWDGRVTVQAQDPKKPENVDEYRVRGGQLEGPIPVRLFGGSDEKTLKANLFDPSDVAFDKIPELVREAGEKVVLEGREPLPSVTIKRKLPFEDYVSIDVDYTGTRKSGYLHTDRHGKHAEVSIF